MTDDEIVERLIQVRGIGRWTVEMLLLFDLGRPDVWPVHDYGVRKRIREDLRQTKTSDAEANDPARRNFRLISVRPGLVFLAGSG